jgi:hypothetical protein
MSEMIAFCGLDCAQCGALIATKLNDDDKRQHVAEEWSFQFHRDLQLQDINCDGCTSDSGVLYSHCEVCRIRRCGRQKQLLNCAYCGDYPCEDLSNFFTSVPEARARLDQIRNGI